VLFPTAVTGKDALFNALMRSSVIEVLLVPLYQSVQVVLCAGRKTYPFGNRP
jgi:hypothetical protein